MGKKKEKNAFLIYHDWETLFGSLDSDEEAGKLIKALLAFAKRGEEPNFTGALKLAFIFMSQQLVRDSDKWIETCEKRQEAINKRWSKQNNSSDTNVYNSIQVNTSDTDTDTDTDTEIIINNNSSYSESVCTHARKKQFAKPSLDEVRAYCKERSSQVNPDRFYSYYESNGWKVGRNMMKDWKAAVRNWETNGFKNDAPDPQLEEYKKVINKFLPLE